MNRRSLRGFLLKLWRCVVFVCMLAAGGVIQWLGTSNAAAHAEWWLAIVPVFLASACYVMGTYYLLRRG